MKGFKFLYLMIFGFFLAGCAKNEILGIGQQGDYIANFDFPTVKVFAPGKVGITNRSKNADKFLWDFSGAKRITSTGDTVVYEASEKLSPDSAFYDLPGEYTVKLTTWQGGQQKEISKKIVVEKLQPTIVAPENIGAFMEVSFTAQVFQYPGQAVSYEWDFGAAGTSTEANPKVTFMVEGPQLVKLTINDGKEILTTEVIVNVQGELAKTIYFTDIVTGKVYSLKLTSLSVSGVKSLDVSTGISPIGLTVRNSKVYLSDAGLGLRYSTGVSANGDGKIKYFNLDGSGETILTQRNVIGATEYNLDPWANTVDSDGNIWWTSRNNGAYVTNASAVEIPYPSSIKFRPTSTNIPGFSTSSYFMGGIKEVNGEIWVSYTGTSGLGIYKFTKAGVFIGGIGNEVAKLGIREFVVDEANNHIYLSVNKTSNNTTPGIYRTNLDGSNLIAVCNTPSLMGFGSSGFSNQGHVAPDNQNETIYVTGMALDVDPVTKEGALYFGYRSNLDVTGTNAPQTINPSNGANSGIIKYNLGDPSNTYSFLLKGYAPYGLDIDQIKR